LPDVTRLEETWADFTDVAQLSRAVVVTARRAAAADGATFVLRDEDRCFYAMEDAMSPLWQGQRFPIDACISGWAMTHNETAIVPNIELDERIPLDAYRPTFVHSLVMTPVGEPEPKAAIGVYWSRVAAPEPEAIARMARIAQAAATVLDRIGLRDAPSAPLQR
jgi:hypothetical protein